jgi:hypothetical protein
MKMIKFNGKNKQLDQKNCFSVEVLTDMSPKKKKKKVQMVLVSMGEVTPTSIRNQNQY